MTPLNVTVIGRTGQLARAIASQSTLNSYNIRCYGRESLDLLSNEDSITDFIAGLENTDVLINAAAYTAVDNAEIDKVAAFKVNAAAPELIAKVCASRAIPFVHISTDYVFDGKKSTPYQINDPTNPLGVYGASKLDGERGVLGQGGQSAVLRTSWVYDGHGKNFFTTMLKLAKAHKELQIVDDQFGRPTYAGHLANAALRVAEGLVGCNSQTKGIFHVSGSGDIISWADFAKSIFQSSKPFRPHNIDVNKITSAEYLTRAKRPAYSVLDITHFEKVFQYKMPDWRVGLDAALIEWLNDQREE